ncbi:MAG: TetR/AcrR family transcriptional regulator [Cyclobacteriaceae bacterium]|nr:TetR/AcrR family transcriptional regulator [Cyclobacteriaceae bacterium]
MGNTKGKIAEVSLALFNEYGIANVSQRMIAERAGISPGNLTYHFKRREEIVHELYRQLVEKINARLDTRLVGTVSLSVLFTITTSMIAILYEYRFFMLDFVHVMKGHPEIKAHHKTLSLTRENQFFELISQLVSNGTMRPERLPDEYKFLYMRLSILLDFWISSAAVSETDITKDTLDLYGQMILQSLFPYLTPQGETEYTSLYQPV